VAQVVGGLPLLQWHLNLLHRSSIREVLLVTGHLADQVDSLVASVDNHGLTITTVFEAQPRGTVQALQEAKAISTADRFLVILGDVWCSFPVNDFLQQWGHTHSQVAAIVHPSLHPQDSDAVIPMPDGSATVIPKGKRDGLHRNMSAAGVFGVTRTYLGEVTGPRDIGSELIAVAAEQGSLYAHVSSHYFKDTGTPDRLDAAERDWQSGAFLRRGRTEHRPGLLLDRDGVINPALPEVYRSEDLSLLPGVAEAIRKANSAGLPVLVATNQPGLAKGFMTEEGHAQIRARLDELLVEHEAFIDDYAYCPHHPEAGHPGEVPRLKISCDCRKPEPGLLLDLISRHALDPAATIMVGDSERDLQAASNAGVEFIRVSETNPASTAIAAARDELTC
jgi:histidinol-phosphate phosphatase family protein